MKFFTKLFIFVLFCVNISFAQTIPSGMKYQAVARDAAGVVITNRPITLKIELKNSSADGGQIYYVEEHKVTTNQIGLFDLVVGGGQKMSGTFENIPWSSKDIWMGVSIKDANNANFSSVSESKLLAVPYAYYAVTAGDINGKAQSSSLRSEADLAPSCLCDEGIAQLKVLYTGPSAVSINVYKDKNLKELITTFNNVNTGAILTVNAASFSEGKLKEQTYFKVGSQGLSVVEVPTKCDDPIIGENFGNFSILSRTDKKNSIECSVCDIRVDWKVGGNGLLDLCNKLGTKSYTDLILITNNIERLRITKDGDISIGNNFKLGKDIEVGNDLTVKRNVYLNTTGGSTTNYGPFTVASMSPTYLTGILTVDKATNLNATLNVVGASTLKNTLTVDGVSTLKNNLNVDGATDLNSTFNVDGTSTLNGLTVVNNVFTVTKDVAEGSFLATFTNLNGQDGDGINIKLGKAKSSYTVPAMPTLLSQAQVDDIKNLIRCDYTGNKIDLLGDIIISTAIDDLKAIAGLAIGTGNMIIKFINTNLGLPISLSAPINTALSLPYNVTAPINTGLGLPFNLTAPINTALGLPLGIYGAINGICDVCVPDADLPGPTFLPAFPAVTIPAIPDLIFPAIPDFSIPAIPTIDLSAIGIPEIPVTDLNFWGIPNICLTDGAGPTPLNNRNEFIRFSDKNNSKMGSIRAESVADWSNNYLNPAFLFSLRGAITSSKIDKFHAQWHFKGLISAAILSYSKIGVEYTSGNGDYAEWLERINTKEFISAGDIVAVIGGKITKDLSNCEQVMVVSHNPIVLGNMPVEGKIQQGNNIAFMGQVPVKILGPVATGDYIIGNSSTPGYGIAKNQKDMSIDDFKHAVGRSWEANDTKEPIMVNTVVGVHNGDYLKILKRYEEKFKETESKFKDSEFRFESLESKVDVLMQKLNVKKEANF